MTPNADITPNIVLEICDPFSSFANTKLNEFSDLMKAQSIFDKLYHYTNDEGLYGILSSGTLWLNDVFNLNDPTELAHGFDLTASWLTVQTNVEPIVKDYLTRCISGFIENRVITRQNNVFVASFSAHQDDLGQWRAYADNGSGFAVEFDGHKLEQAFLKLNGGNNQYSTIRVQYDEDLFIKTMSQVLQKAILALETLKQAGHPENMQQDTATEITSELIFCLSGISSVFKNRNYNGEQEYRFVQTISNLPADLMQIKKRRRPYNLIKYVEFDWKTHCPDALTGFMIGPANQGKAEKFANDCKKEFGLSDVEIYKSKIPYRT